MEDTGFTDLVDYSKDPLEGHNIFGNPKFLGFDTTDVEGETTQHIILEVSLLDPLPPAHDLDAPLLPPGTAAHLPSSLSPDSLALDPLPSPQFDPSLAQVEIRGTAEKPQQEAGIRSSGSFYTPALNVQPPKPSPPVRASNPLIDHPKVLCTKKRKTKCIRTTTKDITVAFGDPIDFEDSMALARSVLVGHVRGRTYSAKRLTLWVKEIWGDLLTELPEVQELPRGWFSLHFATEECTDTVLAQYWHIEMAHVLLK